MSDPWDFADAVVEAEVLMARMQFRDLSQIATPPLEWLIKDVWPRGSHGMWGGAEKSFKSTLATYGMLCVASGADFFGRRVHQGPVVVFTGEGSSALLKRRLIRNGTALGLSEDEVNDLPISVSSLRLPITNPHFQDALRASFTAIGPELVIVDPLYAYHGSGSEGGSVYQEGDLLATLSDVTAPAGVALWVVHHFNKAASASGGRLHLTGLTMAGGREWTDSWVLVAKREEPDFANRLVKLRVETGTRQDEIGNNWDVDIHLDERLEDGTYKGAIEWECRDASETAAEETVERLAALSGHIVPLVRSRPEGLTTTEIRDLLREQGVAAHNRAVTDSLTRCRGLALWSVRRRRSGDDRAKDVWVAEKPEE